MKVKLISLVLLLHGCLPGQAQQKGRLLTMQDALSLAAQHYQLLQAKQTYAQAAFNDIHTARLGRLPDIAVSIQQSVGTTNGLNGFPSGVPGLVTLTSGPATTTQNWNTAFGALYIANIDWTLYAFGAQRSKEAAANGLYRQDSLDLKQETFRQQINVATAYLNLLAAQQYRVAMEKNLQRTLQLSANIHSRAETGVIAGVDSSLANAEVARAHLSLLDAQNAEDQQITQLSIQAGVDLTGAILDSSFVTRLPNDLLTDSLSSLHPILQFFDSRIAASTLQERYIRRSSLPRLSLFGALEDRGSGFGPGYNGYNNEYTSAWWEGVKPIRANYMVGIGFTWNMTATARTRSQAKSQSILTEGLRHEYLLQKDLLTRQSLLAGQQIRNALLKYHQVPIQLRAATDAYTQKSALYDNGLATIVDVTQALYIMNRAEIDMEVANNAVWQAYLLASAATGHLSRFLQQL